MFSSLIYRIAIICVLVNGMIACSGTSTDTGAGALTSNLNIITNDTGSTTNPVASDNSGVVTLSWIPPTENTDGSVLTDLSGYKIYYGTSSESLTQSITINNPGLTEYVIENLSVNYTYYFTITAMNSKGSQSDYSEIAYKNITG